MLISLWETVLYDIGTLSSEINQSNNFNPIKIAVIFSYVEKKYLSLFSYVYFFFTKMCRQVLQ